MAKPRKEILFHYNGYTLHLNVTERHSLRGLRRLIGKKISSYMRPQEDWIFLVNGVQVGKKQEENEMLWRDIIQGDEQKCKVELIEKIPSSLKRKSPPKEEEDEDPDFIPEEVKDEPDLDFEDELGQGTRSRRKKTKRGNPATVTPERVPSNDRSATPDHTNSSAVERAVKPEDTNSGAVALPEMPPSNLNVVQGGECVSNDQPEVEAVQNSDPKLFVIKEETRKRFAEERKESFTKYGDRYLLHRQHPLGIRRLGGNMQNTFVFPRADTPAFQDYDYPIPLHLLLERTDGWITRDDFGYTAYNFTQQPNGPMYAGQKTASVDGVGNHFKKTCVPFPVFMKRTLTTLDRETEGPLIGWEYCGNYRYIPFDPDDDNAGFYESANNFSKASKNEIASCMAKSYPKQDGWGREVAEEWRARLIEVIDKEIKPPPEGSLAFRCIKAGFTADMSGEKLCYVLVELDEYHSQYLIEFVYYDERVYQYCLGGKTNSTRGGKSISGGADGEPAKAQDWYDFATVNMLFKY